MPYLASRVLGSDDTIGENLVWCANDKYIGPRVVVAHPVNFKAVVTLNENEKMQLHWL